MLRRTFVHQSVHSAACLALGELAVQAGEGSSSGRLELGVARLPDPDGHHAALRLKGDWLIVAISDGRHTGLGEISHSNQDKACVERVRELFDRHIAGAGRAVIDPAAVEHLDRGAFAVAPDLITATAISGLNQALLDLVGQTRGRPVWRLFQPEGAPARATVPCYLTLNRFLRERSVDAYLRAVEAALALGVPSIKCAPFEAVTRGGDHVAQAAEGFARLEVIRRAHPTLEIRVDCHERFTPESTVALLSRFAGLGLTWLEEPFPPGPALAELRSRMKIPLAVGELFFREHRFRELLSQGWADIIMPDPKHVGGFHALAKVCRLAASLGGQVSPHNPSGPVATYVALHAAALSPAVTSLELILTSDPARQPGRELLRERNLQIPTAPGWGLPESVHSALTRAG